MKKIISAFSASVVLLSSLSYYKPTEAPVSASDDTIGIMCIGDSITDGYTPEYTGSYRKFIYHYLVADGYDIDMLGAKDGGYTPEYTDPDSGETFEFDNENTGYSGYSIVSYSGREGILETLRSTDCLSQKPDIVTLQIGTNDIIDNYEIDKAGERLEVLVDYILDNISPETFLYVSSVPDLDPNRPDVYNWFGNYRHSADWQEQYSDEQAEVAVAAAVKSYNSQVKQLVEAKQAEGASIVFADVNSVVTDVKSQLFDGVHPNNSGYKAMGAYWKNLLVDTYFSKGDPDLPAVTTTAVTTTTATETSAVTTTEFQFIMPTDPASDLDGSKFGVSELVRMSRYLLGYTYGFDFTQEEISSYDLDKDGRTDVYDLIAARELLKETGRKAIEKMGEGYCLFEGGEDNFVTPKDIMADTDNKSDPDPELGDWVIDITIS